MSNFRSIVYRQDDRLIDTIPLDAPSAEIGMGLTESLAMTPAASVSGFYLAHPEAAYFNVGRIGDDQIADWAKRTGLEEAEARRALASVG
jgi:hypothetical protein